MEGGGGGGEADYLPSCHPFLLAPLAIKWKETYHLQKSDQCELFTGTGAVFRKPTPDLIFPSAAVIGSSVSM